MSALAWCVLAIAAAWLVLRGALRRSSRASDEVWLPAELAEAVLAYSEATFRCDAPFRLVARVDRAYRLSDGRLVLLEFKRRAKGRAFLSDIVELSTQRYVLECLGYRVSPRAFVVELSDDLGSSRLLPVELEAGAAVERRVQRAIAIRSGLVAPRGASGPAVCGGCGHMQICPGARGQ